MDKENLNNLHELETISLHEDDNGDFSYEVIPFTNDQLSTSGLGGSLNKNVELYNKKAKPPRAEKKKLLDLVKTNDSLEKEIVRIDKQICQLVDRYRSDLNIFLRRKYELEKSDTTSSFYDDDDPYESKRVTVVDNEELAQAQRDSNEIFKDLSELEGKRSKINFNRRRALAELASVATKEDSNYYESILEDSDIKIQGIENVVDVTKSKISDFDKEEESRTLKELQNMFTSDFSSLISYDDDEEYEGQRDFENPDYTLDEYIQMGEDHGDNGEIEDIADQFEENYDRYVESKYDELESTRPLSLEEVVALYIPKAKEELNEDEIEVTEGIDFTQEEEESHDTPEIETIDETIETSFSDEEFIEPEVINTTQPEPDIVNEETVLENEVFKESQVEICSDEVASELVGELVQKSTIEDSHDQVEFSPVEKAAKDDNDYVEVQPFIFESLLVKYGLEGNQFD